MVNLRGLDSLRGLLATYVLLGHARWLLWAGHTEWVKQPHSFWEIGIAYGSALLRFGHEAVLVFFVLSGFFIHFRAANGISEGKALALTAGRFYQRRVHRLLAPYLFALVLTFACDLVGRSWYPGLYAGATGDALLDSNFARNGYGLQSVIPAFFLLPSSLGHGFGSNGPLWSLAYEVVYYALYPAWLALRRKSAARAYCLVPIACVGVGVPHFPFFPISVATHYPVWLAGALLAECLVAARPTGWLVAGSILAFAGGICLYAIAHQWIASLVAGMLFGSAIVCAFALLPEGLLRLQLVQVFEFLGIRSYTIYITHFPLLALICALAFEALGSRPLNGWLAVSGGVLALGFCCLCFSICERHFLHPRLRFESQSV